MIKHNPKKNKSIKSTTHTINYNKDDVFHNLDDRHTRKNGKMVELWGLELVIKSLVSREVCLRFSSLFSGLEEGSLKIRDKEGCGWSCRKGH